MARDVRQEWVYRKGTHYLAKLDGIGMIQSVLGVAVPLEGDQFVACIPTDFASYKTVDTLQEARVYVEALNALTQGDKNDDDDDD